MADSDGVRTIRAQINYLADGPWVTRRFVSAGVEHSTGRYEAREVTIRDARTAGHGFTLDEHGFRLAQHRSGIADFHDRAAVELDYPAEAAALVKALTGADLAVPQGWMIRTSGAIARPDKVEGYAHAGGIQPPAGEAHVDYDRSTAHRTAERIYRQAHPDGPPYRRFIASSLWRTFSPPPQDCPLALCEGGSLRDDEGVRNTLHVVDALPSEAEMTAPMEGEEERIAASIFRYSPDHRWWYFPNMRADEVLLFKFFDSDHSVTWRCPHSAFFDHSLPDAKVRESIELRSVAYFF